MNIRPVISSVIQPVMSGVIKGFKHVAALLGEYFLVLNGTNYAELSDPVTLTGDFSITAVIIPGNLNSTWQDIIGGLVNSDSVYITQTSGNKIRVGIGIGTSVESGVIQQGIEQTILFTRTGATLELSIDGVSQGTGVNALDKEVSLIGAAWNNNFQGVIKSVSITDSATPANDVSWTLDSGPPVYAAGSGDVVSDGTMYEPSEEYGVEADTWTHGEQSLATAEDTSTIAVVSGQLYLLDNIPAGVQYDFGSGGAALSGEHGVVVATSTTIKFTNVSAANPIVFTPIVKPVPQGLKYKSVTAADYYPVISNNPDYLWAAFTATATTPAQSVWTYNKTDGHAEVVNSSDIYIYTDDSNSDVEITVADGDTIEWYIDDTIGMQRFYCNSNNVSGELPDLSVPNSFVEVSLVENKLTGSIANPGASIYNLYLRDNLLDGTILSMDGCTNLQRLSLSGNLLIGDIPNFSDSTEIIYYYVYDNQLTGFAGGWPNKAFTFRADNNALTEAAVNLILTEADTYGIATGTTINLSGGTNAAPTGAGATAKANLITNGATVTTN